MSRTAVTLFKSAARTTQQVRRYAPYLSIIRPFTASPSASAATRSAAAPRPASGVGGSSHSNVKAPAQRQMDIRQLNRLEERAAHSDHVGVATMGQQGGVETEEVGVDADEVAAGSHLTFTDIKLSAVLAGKAKYGSAVHAVSDTDSIATAMEIMKMYGIGAVLVRSSASAPSGAAAAAGDTGDIVGIISTRDFVDGVGLGAHPTKASVREFMTESPVFAFDDDNAIACLELMTKHNFRHLPVRHRSTGRCIGLVSIGDLVRVMLKQYRETNTHLKDFIDGKYH